ncbi:M50 family metallopeptidase [Actinomadura flavalba]|uniref:M50 family metallopeptidase n=1 Tax=Actinomadura flavalba TaxID=1120938 RepID=UPI000365B2BA|nr:site-2 protease family protein [Actinomadura flavalba]
MGWLAGVLILFFGLMASIALHELGHLAFAKRFGVRVTQYMVGFGPTLWSRHRGETEYGVKWIPLGGYIRMIGMLPPRRTDAPGQVRRLSTGPWQGLIESARGAALEEVRPGDENRVFYNRAWWQKLLIMFAGPAMNLVLAVVFFAIALMAIGTPTSAPVPTIATVSKCVVTGDTDVKTCPADAPPTPAAKAGLLPGDTIVAFNGQPVTEYAALQRLIRDSADKTATLTLRRSGQEFTVQAPIIKSRMPDLKDPGKTVETGFLGISPVAPVVNDRQSPGEVAGFVGDVTVRSATALLRLPEKMVGVWNAAFMGAERDLEGPVGVVGVGRIGGDIATSEQPAKQKIYFFLMMVASVNLAIGLFNLVPLLPLDGGHMAGAILEAIKKFLARLRGRPDPGPVDVAKALPVTYVMAMFLIVMGGLLIYADIINPIRLSG